MAEPERNFPFFTSPTLNSTVGRRQLFTGALSWQGGTVHLSLLQIQFIVNGVSVATFPIPLNTVGVDGGGNYVWGWEGLIPTSIRPGQAFQVKFLDRGFREL